MPRLVYMPVCNEGCLDSRTDALALCYLLQIEARNVHPLEIMKLEIKERRNEVYIFYLVLYIMLGAIFNSIAIVQMRRYSRIVSRPSR